MNYVFVLCPRLVHINANLKLRLVMYKLDHTGNAVFSLYYHFITVVKYRKKIFDNDAIVSYVKDIVCKVASDMDVEIIEQECGVDHIHIIFKTKPSLNIPTFINYLKGRSSRLLRQKYTQLLKKKLWGNALWSPSYFLATSGNVTIDVIKKYVDNQRRA